MENRLQPPTSAFKQSLAAMALALLCALTFALLPAQAQSFQVLHSFSGGADGLQPYGGLTIDATGRLYGTTLGANYCSPGCGTVYRLTHQGSGWILSTLYQFYGGGEGTSPDSVVTIGPDGSLYGSAGGGNYTNCLYGCGVVYRLQPPPTICRSVTCYWTESVLYAFQGCPNDLAFSGQVAFDASGNLYGASSEGGRLCSGYFGLGGIYQLSPASGGWNYRVLHEFSGPDGCQPLGNVVVDQAGNIFGNTYECGAHNGDGTVWEVSPSGSNWIETNLHSFGQFQYDGQEPFTGLTSDAAGNLYGVTPYGGLNGAGAVFELSPANGGYTYSVLYNDFTSTVGPICRLLIDAAGNLYGTQYYGGASNDGMVFKLTPGTNGWTFTDLHDFSRTDGQYPVGNLAMDNAGHLYGTTQFGGNNGLGVVWQLTP